MTTLRVHKGKVGIPNPNFPFPVEPDYADFMRDNEMYSEAMDRYHDAYDLAVSHMTFFADEEQERAKRYILNDNMVVIIDKDFANGGEVQLTFYGSVYSLVKDVDSGEPWRTMTNRLTPKDGPYTVEDFPPYQKVWQTNECKENPSIATTYQVLRFTKQETKQETVIIGGEEMKVTARPIIRGVEQETKEELKTESQDAWVELSKRIVHAICPHPKTGVSECEMRILKVVGEFEKEFTITRK